MIYKKFDNKMVKLLGKYVEFTPHPDSLDEANAQSIIKFIRLGFSDVYIAFASIIKTLENIPTKIL
jgi:hypothetical protein